jgi:hypothetical protein
VKILLVTGRESCIMMIIKQTKNKLRTYRELKSEYVLEIFLLLDIQKNIVSNFVKLRISNLLIEQGRHKNIPLKNRLCPICKLEIENEYHFVIECNKLTCLIET